MITREQAQRIRQQLLTVLAEDAHNTERLLGRLDSLSRETGVEAHAALLLILTHLAFDESEARRHWEAILVHRAQLSGRLEREIGLRVAVLDYFMNVNRQAVRPTIIDVDMFETPETPGASDPWTGLSSDATFRSAVQAELRRAKRYGLHASVALFDLDDFADFADRHGRLVADRVLREAAILLNNNSRDIDETARPGEDELAILLPETDRNGALLVAERYRRELAAHFARRETGQGAAGLTVSAGVACYPDDATSAEALLRSAAQALYRAKSVGKNAVQVFAPERRHYLRFELEPSRFEVEVLAPHAGRGRPRNLSRNGVLFAVPELLAVGEEIEIRLIDAQIAQGRPLKVRGRVVRLEELPEPLPDTGDRYEVGVAFEIQGGADEGELLEFLEQAQAVRGEDAP